jgi:dolichol kinase
MLAFLACIAGLFTLLVLAELLGTRRILKGEYQRKFIHITAGSFIAFWPWLLSWRQIQVLSILMLLVILAGRYRNILSYNGHVHRVTYGDIFFAMAILICSFISGNKVFFAVAILEVAVADGLAAVAGISYGKRWEYKVFKYKKTVIGSMVFWIASAEILAAGLLAAHNIFSYQSYFYLLLLLPPFLTLLESLAIYGIDNLVIPVATVLILRFFQI